MSRAAREGRRAAVPQVPVPAELVHRDQVRHRGGPQLRGQLPARQQRAQRHQHRPDPVQGERDSHPLAAVGHDQADTGPLADTGLDEAGGQPAGSGVEFVVADPRVGIDHHRLRRIRAGAHAGSARPRSAVSGIEESRQFGQVDLAARQQGNLVRQHRHEAPRDLVRRQLRTQAAYAPPGSSKSGRIRRRDRPRRRSGRARRSARPTTRPCSR